MHYATEKYDDGPILIQVPVSLDSCNSAEDVAKAYVELSKKMGSGELAIPGPDADQETLDKFYSNLRPENADDYKLSEKPEGLADDVEWNEENAKSFEAMAHKNGLTVKQAAAINEWASELAAGAAEGSGEAATAAASTARDAAT